MAKKVVATLKSSKSLEKYVKVIKAVRSPKTGAYTFKEELLPEAQAKNAFKN